MHTAYFSSAVSLRSKGSLSFSFNDYCYFLSERIEKSSYPPCNCCALSIHGLPIYPRFLCGLRQPSLIQCSASRRLILSGSDRLCRLPLYDIDRGCYGVSCSLKESSICRRRRRREGRFGRMIWEEKSENCDSDIDGSAEAMLSLLTEEVSEKFVRRSGSRRDLVEKRCRVVDERSRKEKECAQAKSSDRNSKGAHKSITVKPREEFHQQSGRSEASTTTENDELRRHGSGCSSYHSVSTSGDIDSDTDVQVKHAESVGESSGGYTEKELRSSREAVLGVDVRKQCKTYDEDVGRFREIARQRNAAGSAVGSDTMRNGHEWDLRSKAEKNISEVSVMPVESWEESPRRFSRKREVKESGTKMVVSHEKKFSSREENLTSAVNLAEETRESNSQRGLLVHKHAESRRKSQAVQTMSEYHASDVQGASSSQKKSNGKEEKVTSAHNLVQETVEGNIQTVNETIEKTDLRRTSQQRTKVSKDSNIERAYTSQMLYETGMNVREEKSTSFQSSIQKSEEKRNQNDGGGNRRVELRRESQDLTNVSAMIAGATETTTTSQALSETGLSGIERNSPYFLVDQVHKGRQDESLTSDRIIEPVGLRKESRRPVKASSFPRSTVKKYSSSNTLFHSMPPAGVQHIGVPTEEDENSKIMLTPPSSQLVKVRTRHATIEASGEFSEGNSSSLFTHSQTQNPGSSHEVNVETRTNETFEENPRLVFHDDALGSANRFEMSSSQFIGEFVEKVQKEMSSSEIQKETTSSETMSVYKGSNDTQDGTCQYESEDLQLKRPGSRQSSNVSGSKGPPDEMWDVMDPSLQESSQKAAPEEGTSTTGSAIVRRTGSSFWGVIADVVRMRWGTRSETSNSALKSGGKNSSNGSVNSEAWFSGHEPNENDDEDVKKRRRGVQKEPRSVDQPQLSKASTQSQTEASEATISQDRISEVEADSSSYASALERGITSQGSSLASQGSSLASGEERSSWKEDAEREKGIPSTIAPVDSLLPLPTRRLIRSPVVERTERTPESSKSKVSISDVKEHLQQPTRERVTEVPGTDGKDGELKRRKIQRNKQVPKDRFDEWEKAYMLESEQRKVDKMFMKEALLEAQRAADTWEVPVGAVLVQNGEIIARGCNLVEELRDSTAHAEMICIRKASNLLQTWRLADSTLYVTLEPCAMCAGAILQARIDTVVWGAPNKLLGADGSWVRLFPAGGEGGSNSDLTHQPAGPIHPFHPKITIRRGVLETECSEVMQQFFHLRRMKKEKKSEPEPQPSCLPVSTHPPKILSKIHDMFNIMFCL